MEADARLYWSGGSRVRAPAGEEPGNEKCRDGLSTDDVAELRAFQLNCGVLRSVETGVINRFAELLPLLRSGRVAELGEFESARAC